MCVLRYSLSMAQSDDRVHVDLSERLYYVLLGTNCHVMLIYII